MISIQKWLLTAVILGFLFLAGCNYLDEPTPTYNQGIPFITDPLIARDFTLEYIHRRYGLEIPPAGAPWNKVNLLPGDQNNSAAFSYKNDNIQVVVTYPLVPDEQLVYNITTEENSTGFSWNGILDAYGHITAISVTETEPTITASPIPPPTFTPIPTNSPVPIPTDSPLPPIPTAQLMSPTPDKGPCNQVEFIGDVTIPDGSNFAPGTVFTKTWRLQNTGSCTWTKNYDLVYIGGERMEARREIPLPNDVEPGKNVDLSVGMTSPDATGGYKGYWKLRSRNGEVFGLGPASNQSFTIVINVMTSIRDFRYDFSINFCDAIWRSEAGPLSCSSTETDNDGFVRLLKNPLLEYNIENTVALQVHPNEEVFGWLNGTYPYFTIIEGDRFLSWVGCLGDYGHCKVSFYLDYEGQDGFIHHLGRWDEVYDGKITRVDIDLTDLADQSVRFILGIQGDAREVEDAQGFWLAPRIDEPPSGDIDENVY